MTSMAPPVAIAVFDIDGVLRDVGNSYRRALADTVEEFTGGGYRPTSEDIDCLKGEGKWNNDWEGSQEMVLRYFEGQGQRRDAIAFDYDQIVDFFQRRYRGPNLADPNQWTGYITQEPLLVDAEYFAQLSRDRIAWGFFSGATRGSASFVLERRLGLIDPVVIAMEDAPGKPDPTGLLAAVDVLTQRQQLSDDLPVIYAGDTVADMQTVVQARQIGSAKRSWIGVGVLPPHVVTGSDTYRQGYGEALKKAGANQVISQISTLTATYIEGLHSR
ncbi:TIGR01548 family HAD-type hydrolase [Nodosilinea sp. LEGE 07088]|uniref:TIGR01548 family HAD-type hydrolase n=1 Tax=Nodosilinea sp. LEGE 07088 TaxID=2777968 RepID=UPI00187DDFCF|nr:TIGR01548 family HAD-type hydrolase [Nodosilinea sp. LEGE 07088]MBE9139373.1 TIGR01548 family HAD-type hydrolase [Nodosilinea sp. LEGE 07088]